MDVQNDGFITIGDLTGGEIRGGGDFDELMRTVKSNIDDQYNKNRITGASYSTVYLGALTQVLQTAAAFTLGKCKATYESKLLEEQICQTEWQTCLIMKQVEALDADIAIKQYQLCVMASEKALTEAKTLESACNIPILEAQEDKIIGETAYTAQQCAVAIQQETLITCQQAGTAAQTSLVNQKTITETAQVDASVLVGFAPIAGCECSYEGGGTLGAQIALNYKQRDVFDRDAEIKFAQMMQNSFVVQYTTDQVYPEIGQAKQDPRNIGTALDIARKGIGGTIIDPLPPIPNLASVQLVNGSIVVKWGIPEDIDKVRIFMGNTEESMVLSAEVDAALKEHEFPGPHPGGTYYVAIRGYRERDEALTGMSETLAVVVI